MRLSKAERESVRLKYEGRCAYCGEPLGERWHADHLEHVERKLGFVNGKLKCVGGVHRPENDTIENMMPSCPPCNLDKHAMSLEGWRRKLQGACGVLARNQPTYRHAVRFGLVSETGAPIVFYFERIGRRPKDDEAFEALDQDAP